MKDCENERKEQEVIEDVKKEVIEQKEEKKDSERLMFLIVLIIVEIIIFCLGMMMGAVLFGNKERPIEQSSQQESADIINDQSAEGDLEQEASRDFYDDYDIGAAQMEQILSLKDDVIVFYKNDDITDEQMEEFVEATLNIINLSLSNNDIPTEAINDYNKAIKEINLIDYDKYEFKSTGGNYLRGLKDFIVANSCAQIVSYYKELIPEDKYESFSRIVNRNLYTLLNRESSLQIVIDYGKDLIQEYIGDPDEVFVSTEWRVFTGMPEK